MLNDDDFNTLRALLVVLEGSTARSAVLVVTTAAEPHPRACGWTVRNGWLHPMDTADLQQAVIPSPGSPPYSARSTPPRSCPSPTPTKRAPVPDTPMATAKADRQRASSRISRSLCAKASGCPA
ncbi:hypothetical protein GCM10022206_27210 [Streptomyces chiangmaiensis]